MQPTLSTGAEALEIRWPDGITGEFPYIWLRDTDPAGFHPQTGERTFDLTAVPLDVAPRHAEIVGNQLQLEWQDLDRPSHIDLDWIKANRPGLRRPDPADIAPFPWRSDLGGKGVPRHDAQASWIRIKDWQAGLRRPGAMVCPSSPGWRTRPKPVSRSQDVLGICARRISA